MGDFISDTPSTEEILKIHQWLEPTEYNKKDSEYDRHRGSHVDGTNQWLVESSIYKQWKESKDCGLIWINGIPGSGKSVYAAHLVDYLGQDGSPVLYFFFRHIVDKNNTALGALRDWLDQLLDQSVPLQLALWDYVKTHRSLESVSAADFIRHLKTALFELPTAYIVADALDEMKQDDMPSFVDDVLSIGEWRPADVKIAITSRPVPRVQTALKRVNLMEIRLDEQKVDLDISTYVQYCLSNSEVPQEYHKLIADAVPGKANGLFLYAKLAMNTLLQPGIDPEAVIRDLPLDLNVMYTNLLQESATRSSMPLDTQILIMQLVTHASHPLRLLELAQAIHVTQYLNSGDGMDLKMTKTLVRSAAGSLLEVLPTELVSVVHHSLTEFLTGITRSEHSDSEYPVFHFGETHARLALVCLSYLKLHGLADFEATSSSVMHNNVVRSQTMGAFTRYAGRNWHVHANKAASAGIHQPQLVVLLDELVAADATETLAKLSGRIDNYTKVTVLYLAVALQIDEYTRHLLRDPKLELNIQDGMERSPLAQAAKSGQTEIAKLLLDRGADPFQFDHTPFFRRTPLHIAAENNSAEIVTMLLKLGADPLFLTVDWEKDDEYRTETEKSALEFAATEGHVGSVAAMLPAIEEPKTLSMAAEWAASNRRSDVVALVCKHPRFQVNAKVEGATPLMSACGSRDSKSIRHLLAAGADVSEEYSGRPTGYHEPGQTALHAWSKNRPDPRASIYGDLKPSDGTQEECFRLLLKAGADLHHRDGEGQTPLLAAADVLALRLLVEAGADPNAVTNNGTTILNVDGWRLDEDMIKYIVTVMSQEPRTSTSTSPANKNVLPPLLLFLDHKKYDRVIILLEAGIDAKAVDKYGNGAFHYFARFDSGKNEVDKCRRIIDLLGQAGAEINLRNDRGQTAMHMLGSGPQETNYGEMQRLDPVLFPNLIAKGADLGAVDNTGRTPLMSMVQFSGSLGYEEAVLAYEVMIAAGSNVHITDFRNRNLMFAAINHGKPAPRDWLIRQGVDPKATDNEGYTVFHAAICHANRRFHRNYDGLNHLIEIGIDPYQSTHAGRTPLHTISGDGPFRSGPNFHTSRRTKTTAFEYVLDLYRDRSVDESDNIGVTALHLASTFSEHHTKSLLEAGADPSLRTHEGMTVLHLAARARQPNVVGVLLEILQERKTVDELGTFLDLKDEHEKTALFYACASGVVESADLLIVAGATIDSAVILDACAVFEEEDSRWPRQKAENEWCRRDDCDDEGWWHGAGSVSLTDNFRTNLGPPGEFPEGRLEKILTLVTEAESPFIDQIDEAITKAESLGSDYCVRSLKSIRVKQSSAEIPDKDQYALTALTERETLDRANTEDASSELSSEPDNISTFNFLMSLRAYDLAPQGLTTDDCVHSIYWQRTVLHDLAREGHSSVLEKLLTPELLERSYKRDGRNVEKPLESLLVTACTREKPNMDVIRLLVEGLGVDVNGKACRRKDYPSGDDIYDETALHILARGKNWWQTALAIPYLVAHGADLEARDTKEQTPLITAMVHYTLYPGYSIRPFEALAQLGAEIHAISQQKVTSLDYATKFPYALKRLLSSVISVGPKNLLAAIRSGDLELVKLVLRNGCDPNGGPKLTDHIYDLQGEEYYPLHIAARNESPETKAIISTLLDYGADPSARYDKTVLTNFLMESSCADLFVRLPSIDLQASDQEGLTLLLAACKFGNCNAANLLLDQGIDFHVQDINGRNALHYLLLSDTELHSAYVSRSDSQTQFVFKVDSPFPQLLARLASDKTLINRADNQGHTPIYTAMQTRRYNTKVFDILLSAGANPWVYDVHGNTVLSALFTKDRTSEEAAYIFRSIMAWPGAISALNSRNDSGEPALFELFRFDDYRDNKNGTDAEKRLPLLHTLNEFEAEINWAAVNSKGMTLLHLAADYSDLRNFRYLLGKGVDPMVEDEIQRSALDVAADRRADGILALFDGKRGIPGRRPRD